MKKYLFFLLMLLFFLSGTCGPGYAEDTLSPAIIPDLVAAIRIDGPVDFCGEKLPLDSAEIRERLEKELLLILWDRPQIILWLKRSTRYFPYIEALLAQNNMPDDLKYIAVIESAMLPHAGSSMGAVGYWQFIKSTGLNHGLTINQDIDERRNFYASTRAAINYLKKLHDLFGSWTLAAAAYNMGEDRLQEEKTRQLVDNYYEFYLPMETQRYIFKIIAAKLIFADPARYGFYLQPDDYYPPIRFDRVKVNLEGRMPLSLIAKAAGTYFKKIKDLNPELTGGHLPKGSYIVAVPEGSGESFHTRFAALSESWQRENRMHIYIVQKGDNLSSIAERFDVALPALMAWNDLKPGNYIHPGEKLVIYQ